MNDTTIGDIDMGRVRGKQREIDAEPCEARAEGIRRTGIEPWGERMHGQRLPMQHVRSNSLSCKRYPRCAIVLPTMVARFRAS